MLVSLKKQTLSGWEAGLAGTLLVRGPEEEREAREGEKGVPLVMGAEGVEGTSGKK